MALMRFLGVFVLVLSACSGSPDARKQQHYDSGNRYFSEKKFAEARIEYQNAIAIDPKFAEARIKLAETLVRLGDRATAMGEYVRAADLLPDNTDLQLEAAAYLLGANRADDAKARAEVVLRREPRNVRAQVLLGNALAGLKDLDAAVREMEEAVHLDPSGAPVYANLGALHLARGDRSEAEKAFKRAVELEPKWISGHLALGHHYWTVGEAKLAEESFHKALALDANDALANRTMALFSLATGRVAEAEPYLKTVVRAQPAAVTLLADYYLGTGRTKDAIALLEPVVASTRNPHLTRQLTSAYAQSGDRAKAHQMVDGLIERAPQDSESLLLKGQLLTADGQREAALERVGAAVERNPDSIQAQFTLGRLYAARGDVDGAKKAYNEVLRLNPRAVPAQLELARLYLAEGSADASGRAAQDALRTQPTNPEARLALVRALLAQRQLTQAEAQVRGLLASHPTVAAVQAQYGALLLAKGDIRGARGAFERAASIDGGSVEAIGGLAALDLSARDFEAAIRRVQPHVEAATPRIAVLLLGARVYAAAAKPDEAERALRRVIEMDPTVLAAYGMLGQIYVSQKKLDAARAEFEALAQRQPRPVAALTMAGTILQAQGNVPLARQRFEQALAIDERAPLAANNLAWIYAEAGENLDLALQLARTAQAGLPDSAAVADTLGWVYYKRKQPAEAIAAFTSSLAKDPADPVYHYHLGLAQLQAGNIVNARVALEKALSISATFPGADDAKRQLAQLSAVHGSSTSPAVPQGI